MATYVLPSLQCVHVRNVLPSASAVRAFPELTVFPFYFAFMQRMYQLLFSGYRCAKLTTDHSNLLSLLLQNFVRKGQVCVLALDPILSVHFYRVGISVVSVIASWPPKVPQCSLSIIEVLKTF